MNPFRSLPSVNEVFDAAPVRALAGEHAHDLIVAAIRAELTELRQRIGRGESIDGQADVEAVAARVARRLGQELRPRLRPVINATGIVLHTNLGRAPVAEAAAKAAYEAARGYLNLELDLETGKRSSRQDAIRDWVCRLTGAESATAVNNNAAATVIVLRALCTGKEVIISRGQLVEIGGSFRIPEIMAVSGAVLREVGATNITRLGDYEKAIGPATGALLRVHCSNYRISGHTASVPLEELVALGRKSGLPVIDDIGSGALLDFNRFGFRDEPVARQSIAAGADLVLFSGDKLVGGPQAGIIAGRKEFIQRIEKDPLMRAFRLDKMTLAALEATLRLYLNEERALREVPVLRLLGVPLAELRQRAEALAARLRELGGIAAVRVAEEEVPVGGGSLPEQTLQSAVLEVEARGLSDAELAHRLRTAEPAVLGRMRDGKVILDVRTVFPPQEAALLEVLRRVVPPSSAPASPPAPPSNECKPPVEVPTGGLRLPLASSPLVSPPPARLEKEAEPEPPAWPARWEPVPDSDLPLIEQRCRLKAEAARWAAMRRHIDYRDEREMREELIERASALPSCFLWMCPLEAPSPQAAAAYPDLAGCFDAVADLLPLVRKILEAPDLLNGELVPALELLAEAQSALRIAVTRTGEQADGDQTQVFIWLLRTANEHRLFIRRHMRTEDPADPARWPDLRRRIGELEQRVQEAQKRVNLRKKVLGKVRHKVSLLTGDPARDAETWQSLAATVDELVGLGVPPSNRELRELLLPVIEEAPELPEAPRGFQFVLREIDRYLENCPEEERPAAERAPSPAVRRAAELLAGRSLVLIGGERRPGAERALKESLGLEELIWLAAREHQSVAGFEPYVARPDVAVVVLAIRWSSHSFGEVKEFCDRYGKPLVRLPGGYNPNQVALQILEQCSERLRAG
jgi:L-seryl-tRNA(Ser) seleniumtransferase